MQGNPEDIVRHLSDKIQLLQIYIYIYIYIYINYFVKNLNTKLWKISNKINKLLLSRVS